MPRVENNIVIGDEDNTVHNVQMSFLFDLLRKAENNVVLIDAAKNIKYTADHVMKESIRFAVALRKLNVGKGDILAVCCENRFEFLTCALGAFAANVCIAPLNVTYTERELNHVVNISKPKLIAVTALNVRKISKLVEQNKFIKHVIAIDEKPKIEGSLAYKSLLRNVKESEINEFVQEPSNPEETLAIILSSSGTTGLPKGVGLSQRNVLTTVRQLNSRMGIMSEFNFFSIIPWFHGYGCLTLLSFVCSGLKLAFLQKFEETLFLKTIEKYQIDIVFIVPPVVVFLAKHPLVDNYDVSSLKVIYSGAAPLSKETEEAAIKRLGLLAVRQGYGLSETTLAVLGQNEEPSKPGSVGTVVTNVRAKVVDVETGRILGPNERGELCFKGDVIMKGYVNDPKSTAEVIDADGWLHTGDVGYYDEDLSFFIVDRIKELIKYKGFQVPPAELEALLLTHPKVKDAAVVGLPNEEAGELPVAYVVKQIDTNPTEQEIIDFIAERVSPPKRLRGGVRFVPVIPRNPSGKILRRELKEKLRNEFKSKL